MSKKILGILLSLCLMFGVTACGDVPADIDLSDFVSADISAYAKADKPEYTAMTAIEGAVDYVSYTGKYVKNTISYTVEKDGVRENRLYDVKADAEILEREGGYDTISQSGDFLKISYTVSAGGEAQTYRTLYGDGKALLPVDIYEASGLTASVKSMIYEGKSVSVLCVTGDKTDGSSAAKYYLAEDDTLTEVAEGTLTTDTALTPGSVIGGTETVSFADGYDAIGGEPAAKLDGDAYAKAHRMRVTQNLAGDKLVRIYDAAKAEISAFSIPANAVSSGVVCYASGAIFYLQVKILPADASKYNLVSVTNIGTVKTQITLTRVDLNDGKAKEIATGKNVVNALTPLLDKDGNYSAVLASGLQTDGKFASAGTSPVSVLVLNADGKIAGDISERETGIPVIKLKDDRFMTTDGEIVDGKGNLVASVGNYFNGFSVQNELILIRVNGAYGAVDFDGKIVIEPKYSALTFYGSRAYAAAGGNGYLVSKDGAVAAGVEDHYADGLNWVRASDSGVYTLTVKNYAGTELKRFNSDTAISTDTEIVGGKSVVKVTTSSAGENSVGVYIVK